MALLHRFTQKVSPGIMKIINRIKVGEFSSAFVDKGSHGPAGTGDGKKDEDINAPYGLCLYCQATAGEGDSSCSNMYDTRKYGHKLPTNSVVPPFEPLPKLPTGIFRCTAGESLGLGADKTSYYPCPEYFSYHHMSYYDMHLVLRDYRRPSPKTGRKP